MANFRDFWDKKIQVSRDLKIGGFAVEKWFLLLFPALKDMFTLNNQIHSYNTRSSKSFHLPRTRTKLRQFSIKYQGLKTFNSLNSDIKESVNYSSFTKKLKSHLISKY